MVDLCASLQAAELTSHGSTATTPELAALPIQTTVSNLPGGSTCRVIQPGDNLVVQLLCFDALISPITRDGRDLGVQNGITVLVQ
jgi:hypothetical protein